MDIESEVWQCLEKCRLEDRPVSPDVQELVDRMAELFDEKRKEQDGAIL